MLTQGTDVLIGERDDGTVVRWLDAKMHLLAATWSTVLLQKPLALEELGLLPVEPLMSLIASVAEDFGVERRVGPGADGLLQLHRLGATGDCCCLLDILQTDFHLSLQMRIYIFAKSE